MLRASRIREGLDQGDAKLLAVLLGLGFAPVARPPGESLGATTALPFGPALAVATIVHWLTQAWAGQHHLSDFDRLVTG